MKKIIIFVCLVLSSISVDFTKHGVKNKEKQDRVIEEQSKAGLILKPFKFFGLLWSCTPGDDPDGGGGGSHQSHRSHSSHYSSR